MALINTVCSHKKGVYSIFIFVEFCVITGTSDHSYISDEVEFEVMIQQRSANSFNRIRLVNYLACKTGISEHSVGNVKNHLCNRAYRGQFAAQTRLRHSELYRFIHSLGYSIEPEYLVSSFK